VDAALQIYLQARRGGGNMDVNLTDVVMKVPGTTTNLLEGAALKLVAGRRYGLIGRNGIGKSTLLRAIATYSIDKFPRHVKIM